MAQVLLTHSYHLPFDPKQLRKMQPYMPLGTLYAATALRENGISVAAFDSMLEEPSAKFDAFLAEHASRKSSLSMRTTSIFSRKCASRG